MKRCVEHGNVHGFREQFASRIEPLEVVGIVQRRQLNGVLDFLDGRRLHEGRPRESFSPVNNAVPYAANLLRAGQHLRTTRHAVKDRRERLLVR